MRKGTKTKGLSFVAIITVILLIVAQSFLNAGAFSSGPKLFFCKGFDENHRSITDDAFERLKQKTGDDISKKAREKIKDANDGQDSIYCYKACPGISNFERPEHHGDRGPTDTSAGAFERLRKDIKEETDRAIAGLKECTEEGLEDALKALGRAIHGIEDFYSHSNYVDPGALTDAEKQQAKNALDPFNPQTTPPANLKMTGYGMSSKNDPEGYHHDDKNKDSKDCPMGENAFNAAKEAAAQHVAEYLEALKGQLSEEEWNKLLTYGIPGASETSQVIRTGGTSEIIREGFPDTVVIGETYSVLLRYVNGTATELKTLEGMPNGAVFLESNPPPTTLEIVTLSQPDKPATIVTWFLTPVGEELVEYSFTVTDDALTNPTVVIHCGAPIQGYLIFHGQAKEVDDQGNESLLTIDKGERGYARIETSPVVGIASSLSQLELVASYIIMAALAVLAVIMTTIHFKRNGKQ